LGRFWGLFSALFGPPGAPGFGAPFSPSVSARALRARPEGPKGALFRPSFGLFWALLGPPASPARFWRAGAVVPAGPSRGPLPGPLGLCLVFGPFGPIWGSFGPSGPSWPGPLIFPLSFVPGLRPGAKGPQKGAQKGPFWGSSGGPPGPGPPGPRASYVCAVRVSGPLGPPGPKGPQNRPNLGPAGAPDCYNAQWRPWARRKSSGPGGPKNPSLDARLSCLCGFSR